MSRIRTIKPEWMDDERMAAMSDSARLLSVGLILLADDHGRGRAHPLFLASRVWSYGDPRESLAKVERGLAELAATQAGKPGFIALYEVAGQSYYAITNWSKHQKVDHKGPPRVPAPDVLASASRGSREVLAPDPDHDHDHDHDREGITVLPPLGRLLHGFKVRWESKTPKLGAGWPGVGPHGALADTIAAQYADDPAGLEASLDGYFASADPFAVKVRWNFKAWANDPGRWVATQADPDAISDARWALIPTTSLKPGDETRTVADDFMPAPSPRKATR